MNLRGHRLAKRKRTVVKIRIKAIDDETIETTTKSKKGDPADRISAQNGISQHRNKDRYNFGRTFCFVTSHTQNTAGLTHEAGQRGT